MPPFVSGSGNLAVDEQKHSQNRAFKDHSREPNHDPLTFAATRTDISTGITYSLWLGP